MKKEAAVIRLKKIYKKFLEPIESFRYAYPQLEPDGTNYKIVVGFLGLDEISIVLRNNLINLFKSDFEQKENLQLDDYLRFEQTKEIDPCSNLNLKIQPSISIGSSTYENSGTLGMLVKIEEQHYLLTCNHVLKGDLNVVTPGYADISLEEKTKPKKIAKLIAGAYTVNADVAFARVHESKLKAISHKSVCDRTLKYNVENFAKENLNITFCKRTSEKQAELKTIISTSCIVRVKLPENGSEKYFDFFDQIITAKNTERGDSGAIAHDANNNAIAMVFAHSPKLTFLSPIHDVFTYVLMKLNITTKDIENWEQIRNERFARYSGSYNNSLKKGIHNDFLSQNLQKIEIINL